MKSRYETFDRSRLTIKPLAERQHDMRVGDVLGLDETPPPFRIPT